MYTAPATSGCSGPYGLRMDNKPDNCGSGNDGPTFSVGDDLDGLGGPVFLSWNDADLSAGALLSGPMYRESGRR